MHDKSATGFVYQWIWIENVLFSVFNSLSQPVYLINITFDVETMLIAHLVNTYEEREKNQQSDVMETINDHVSNKDMRSVIRSLVNNNS